MDLRVVFARIIQYILVTFLIGTEFPYTLIAVALIFVLFHGYQIISRLVESTLFRIQNQHSSALILLQKEIVAGMQTVESCSMSLNCESELADLERNGVHDHIFSS
jgi:hypothetical protein